MIMYVARQASARSIPRNWMSVRTLRAIIPPHRIRFTRESSLWMAELLSRLGSGGGGQRRAGGWWGGVRDGLGSGPRRMSSLPEQRDGSTHPPTRAHAQATS